jgi:hypothetical protein
VSESPNFIVGHTGASAPVSHCAAGLLLSDIRMNYQK